jgi:hypothetical protein
MSTKNFPLKMSTRIHCPREFSIPFPWAGEIVLICHSFLVVLICWVNKKSGNVLPVYTKLIHMRGNFDRSYGQLKKKRVFNQNWSSIWNSNLRWNLTSMFHLSFRPCCQTREIFAILNEIVHEFEWSKGQKVSKTNWLNLTSFKKLTKIFCPISNYVAS